MSNVDPDLPFLGEAVRMAREALNGGNHAYGAVVVRNGTVIARGHNVTVTTFDPSGHAEIEAVRRAALASNSLDLSDCDLYSTCEPCPLCVGIVLWTRVRRVIYGARDVEYGATSIRFPGFDRMPEYRHLPSEECEQLLRTAKSQFQTK